jgi:hypothetical protein
MRLAIGAAAGITQELQRLYTDGWRVVTHTESRDEYTFVLERDVELPSPPSRGAAD